MEEIEYLEEYEDLILPMSFAVDDGKCNEGLDGRKSIDSLEMLYKDLIEDTSLEQNQADTSPFSLNPQMISPEKTILSSSTVEIGLAQSFPNYSLNTTPPGYVTTSNTDTLQPYQVQTPNIQYLNRVTNKSFSSYSSLQKPDKLKSVATVKPTLQRVNNPPKQYIQRESPIFKTIISGQSASQSQHIFSKPSSAKTTFGVGTSKSKKISKLSASGADPLAGLVDDALLDFDEKNGLVDGFDFESDLENSIIAGLSDMDSDSVDLSDEFIDENFDLESDLSSDGSDLKKLLKRKRSQTNSQESQEQQNTKSVNDSKRDASSSVKKKPSHNNKDGSEMQQIQKSLTAPELNEKPPTTSSSAGRDSPLVVYSTKVNEVVANASNIFPHLSSKLNELEQAHVSNVHNLTPTVPLYTKAAEKTENGLKQILGLPTTPNEKSSQQKKDDRIHAIIDPFRGFPEIVKPMGQQIGDVVKRNLFEPNLNKSPLKNTGTFNPTKDESSDKSIRLKLGSLYLRSIKPPTVKASPIKSATSVVQQANPFKTPAASQPPKAAEESCKTSQKNVTATTVTQNMPTNCPVVNAVADVSKTLNAVPSTPDATKIAEKCTAVPKTLEAKDKNQEPTENVKVMPQLKRQKSLGSLNDKESVTVKNQESMEKPKAQAQPRAQKNANITTESSSKKESTLPQAQDGKQRDSIAKPKSQIQSITPKAAQEAKKDDLSAKPQPPLKQKGHVEEKTASKPEKTNAIGQDISDKSKVQFNVKQKGQVEEKNASKFEKANVITKSQEPNDRVPSETTKVLSPPKVRCVEDKTAATPVKSTTPQANEVKERDVSEKKEQIRRRRLAGQRNRSKSADRTADLHAAATESKEITEKQVKPARKSAGDKRSDAVCNRTTSGESGDAHQKTEQILLGNKTALSSQSDKESPLQQNHETSVQKKSSPLVQETSIPPNRRKKFGSRKFKGRNSDQKESSQASDAPPVAQTAEIPPKPTSTVEAQKAVISSQETPVAVAQPLQKVPTQRVQTITPTSSRQTARISSKAKSAKIAQRQLKSISPRKAVSREQTKIDLRQFKVRLNRKTVDHFMKSLKETGNKNSDLNMVTPTLSNLEESKITTPRCVGRPRKHFPIPNALKNPQMAANSEQKVVHSDAVQPPVVSTMVTLPKVTPNEPNVGENVGLEANSCPSLKRRKRKKMRSNFPAKILRSDKTTDKSDIPNKDCISDSVPLQEQGLASISSTKANPAQALAAAAPTKATNLPVSMATSNSSDPANVVKPVTSGIVHQTTTSPTVPTVARSPTFPTDAASPATPTDDSSPKVTKAAETPTTLNDTKKRGRPYSKKHARRIALSRRRELIRASTLQRLPTTPSPEDPTPETAAIDTELVVVETSATSRSSVQENGKASEPPVQARKTGSSAASQPCVQNNAAAPASTPQTPVQIHKAASSAAQSRKTKSLANSQTVETASSTTRAQTNKTTPSASLQLSVPAIETTPLAKSQPKSTAVSVACQPPTQANETDSSIQTKESASSSTSEPLVQIKATTSSGTSQPADGHRLSSNNLVQPKSEFDDPTNPNYQVPTMFDAAPAVYSFAKPTGTCRRNSELFLDACQIAATSFAMEQNGATESVAVFELPSYIVMRTRIITRGELEKTKTAVQPQVVKPLNKLAENGQAEPVVKEEAPNFKDICLEINTLLGRNANYLKFASGSERQARMSQVLSDSSLSVQEAQSALKFLQSYLSARSIDAAVNNAKGQQFIPIYDSQKKVIGYRKRRVHPKRSPPSTELTKKSGRLLIRSTNPSISRTTSTISTTEIQQIVVEFSAKKEPQTMDGGDEELIVPDVSLSTNAIKSELES